MKTAIVTGYRGFIGLNFTNKLLSEGWKVYGIDKETYASNSIPLNNLWRSNLITHVKEDICDLERLPDCDYIFNFAAESHVANSIEDSSCFIKSNVDGVRNLLDLIRKKPDNVCARPVFVHISTDEVYGDIVEGSFKEEQALNPSNPYSVSKAAADMLIKAYARTYGVQYNIIRPTNNYGLGQYPEKLIPLSVKLLQREKKIRLHNQGTPIRNWLHVEDTANAILDVVEFGELNEVYNIAGEEKRNLDVVLSIIDAYHRPTVIENYEQLLDFSYNRSGQDVRYSVDDSKLRSLGWTPKKKFDEEIQEIVRYYKNAYRW